MYIIYIYTHLYKYFKTYTWYLSCDISTVPQKSQAIAPMPEQRSDATVTVLRGCLYVCGGQVTWALRLDGNQGPREPPKVDGWFMFAKVPRLAGCLGMNSKTDHPALFCLCCCFAKELRMDLQYLPVPLALILVEWNGRCSHST